VLEGRTGKTATAGGTRLWAGRIADSFYIDLSLLSIINGAVAKGTAPDLSGWRPDNAKNSFGGTIVETIVLEVPTSTRSCGPAPVPVCGVPPSWPPTPAAGGRSTARSTP
jgi:hypothetical protein